MAHLDDRIRGSETRIYRWSAKRSVDWSSSKVNMLCEDCPRGHEDTKCCRKVKDEERITVC